MKKIILFLMLFASVNLAQNVEMTSERILPYGELHDPSTVIATATAGYYTLTGWTGGNSYLTTLDTDSTIQVLKRGAYLLSFSMSFTHSIGNTVVHISAFNSDGAEYTNIETERKIGTAGDYGNVGGVGIIFLEAGEKVSVRAKADKSGNLTVNHGNFNIVRMK